MVYENAVWEGDVETALTVLEVIEKSGLDANALGPAAAPEKGTLRFIDQEREPLVQRKFEDAVLAKLGQSLALENGRPSPLVEWAQEEPSWLKARALKLLDALFNAEDTQLVSRAYRFLLTRGYIGSFGSYVEELGSGQLPRMVSPSVLREQTGLEAINLSPQKPGLSGPSMFATLGLLALFSALGSNGVDLRPPLALILALGLMDSTLFGGAGAIQLFSLWPPYRKRVLVHEAGHFLAAYLLGCPVSGVVLDPLKAKERGIQGQAGTQFWDEALDSELKEGRLSSSSMDRYCVVMFAGVAAEALVYGQAEGGESDENLFKALLSSIQPPMGPSKISNQARWSVMHAYLLLKRHNRAHAALVRALEGNAPLSVLVETVETALEDSGVQLNNKKD